MDHRKELEKILQRYSNIPVLPQENETYEVPETILNYQRIVAANNACSIYDTSNYTPCNNSDSEDNFKSKPSFENEPVIRVPCGRGRGILRQNFKPGQCSSNDDEIRKDLRRIAPLGYGNEITELSVKAHRTQQKNNSKLNDISNSLSHSQPLANGPANSSKLIGSPTPSPPGISKLLRINRQECDQAYREYLRKKEEKYFKEQEATDSKIKELLEEDRKEAEKVTEIEMRFDETVSESRRRNANSSNLQYPWPQSRRSSESSSKWSIKSTDDFPPLSGK